LVLYRGHKGQLDVPLERGCVLKPQWPPNMGGKGELLRKE